MIRLVFILYWIWHSSWIYRFFYVGAENADKARLFMIEGIYSLFFICLIPSVLFIWREKSKNGDYKWWKISILTAIIRVMTYLSALHGYEDYYMGFGVSIFAIAILIGADNSFKKNSENVVSI